MTSLIQRFDPARHSGFLADESLRSGRAETISFPKDATDVRQVLQTLADRKVSVTVQGSRTGIAGDAVPSGGHILNLCAMNRILGMDRDDRGRYCVQVQSGVTLADLNLQLASRQFEQARQWDRSSLAVLDRFQNEPVPWIWPPDPTEDTATIGGMAATNARGLCVHAHGRARQHIGAGKGVDRRGIEQVLVPVDNPDSRIVWDSDLPVITELTLTLMPEPSRWGIGFFFPAMAAAVEFIDSLQSNKMDSPEDACLAAVEIMDHTTLEIIEAFKADHPAFKNLPHVDQSTAMAVYLELHGHSEDALADAAERLMQKVVDAGGDPDASLAATTRSDLSRLRLLRKAAPHAAHWLMARVRQTDDRITRLGWDWTQTGPPLATQIQTIESDLAGAGVTGALYGHAADHCLHVTLLPNNHEAFLAGKSLIRHWTQTDRT